MHWRVNGMTDPRWRCLSP